MSVYDMTKGSCPRFLSQLFEEAWWGQAYAKSLGFFVICLKEKIVEERGPGAQAHFVQ